MDVSSLPNDPKQLKAVIQQMNLEHQQELDAQRRDLIARLEAERQQEIERQQQELQQRQQEIERLNQIIAYLRRKMYGPRSEKINANQLLLFGQSVLPLTSAEPATEVPEAKLAAKRPGLHGRRIIPDDLPRETVVVDVPEEQKPCPDCGTDTGEDRRRGDRAAGVHPRPAVRAEDRAAQVCLPEVRG